MPERTVAAATDNSQRAQPAVRLPIVGQVPLPSTGQLLWLGGLGAMAALEVIEWPVALVAAAGTYIAEQSAKNAGAGTTRSSARS